MSDDPDDTKAGRERKSQEDIAKKYLKTIAAYDKAFKPWATRCEKLIKIYTEARRQEGSKTRRMSLLWSNVSTMQAAVYAREPKPEVGRRFQDRDPVARHACEIMERAISFTFDDTDFDGVMRLVRDDYLLVGRGTSWPRYEADFDELTDDEGNPLDAKGDPITPEDDRGDDYEEQEPGEELAGERVELDFVSWRDFGHNLARTWREVDVVWRKVYLGRDDGVKRFGEQFRDIDLDYQIGETTDEKGPDAGADHQATVYEIWDKKRRKVVFLAKGGKVPLEEGPPHLKFKGFFPCPKPVYGTLHTASLIPVPDYVFYQDQVEEIDDLTARIAALTDQLKIAGIYASTGTDASEAIQQLGKPGIENCLIPVKNWAQFKEGGGVKGMIEWWPVEQVAVVLKGCFEARKELIQDVYQITGISDIMRGEGEPDETAAAQHIKSQWGSVRVRDRQHALAAFARENARKVAEIIAQCFTPETLMEMTNVKLPTQAEVEQAAIQAQQQALQQQAATLAQQQQMPQAPPQPAMGAV